MEGRLKRNSSSSSSDGSSSEKGSRTTIQSFDQRGSPKHEGEGVVSHPYWNDYHSMGNSLTSFGTASEHNIPQQQQQRQISSPFDQEVVPTNQAPAPSISIPTYGTLCNSDSSPHQDLQKISSSTRLSSSHFPLPDLNLSRWDTLKLDKDKSPTTPPSIVKRPSNSKFKIDSTSIKKKRRSNTNDDFTTTTTNSMSNYQWDTTTNDGSDGKIAYTLPHSNNVLTVPKKAAEISKTIQSLSTSSPTRTLDNYPIPPARRASSTTHTTTTTAPTTGRRTLLDHTPAVRRRSFDESPSLPKRKPSNSSFSDDDG